MIALKHKPRSDHDFLQGGKACDFGSGIWRMVFSMIVFEWEGLEIGQVIPSMWFSVSAINIERYYA